AHLETKRTGAAASRPLRSCAQLRAASDDQAHLATVSPIAEGQTRNSGAQACVDRGLAGIRIPRRGKGGRNRSGQALDPVYLPTPTPLSVIGGLINLRLTKLPLTRKHGFVLRPARRYSVVDLVQHALRHDLELL